MAEPLPAGQRDGGGGGHGLKLQVVLSLRKKKGLVANVAKPHLFILIHT